MGDPTDNVLDRLPIGALELDGEGRLLLRNREARRVLSRGGEARGDRLVDHAVPEHELRISAALEHAVESGRAVVRFLLAGELPRTWVEAIVEASDLEGGRRFAVILREVTSENELLAWIESSPLPTVVGRPTDGTILMANDAFVETSGFDRDSFVGKPGAALSMWTDLEVRERVVRELREHGRVVGEEVTFVDAKGEEHHALLSAQVTRLMGGDAVVYQTLDVTRQRQIEERLAQLDRIESLAMLAGGMAHDFNNLLQAVMGQLDIAETRTRDEAVIDAIERASAAAARAAELTRQLLDFAGGGDPVREPVDLDAVADDVIDLLADTALSEVAVDRVRGADRVSASATQVRQVLLNLLGNAADATSGRPKRAISVRSATLTLAGDEGWLPRLDPGEYGVIEVVDNGPGFSAEAAQRAFEPFFTTRATGRGLGLASVLGLVRRFGGGVRLARRSPGATIQVALPRWDASDPTRSAEPAPVRTGSVLVVDDEKSVRAAVATMARSGGWRAQVADGLEGAVARLERSTPGVVVLDVRMPGVLGADGLRAIKRAAPGIPVVLMTGFTDESVHAELRRVGYAELLEKPFGASRLLEALSRALG